MPKLALVGIGNPFRADDGAGWKVVDALKPLLPKTITLAKIQSDPALLLNLFATHSHLFLVDATEPQDWSDGWCRFDLTQEIPLIAESTTSTHGFTLQTTLELARTLNTLPSHLILYALSADDFSPSPHLSPRMQQTLPKVIQTLKKEIETCMNTAS